MQRESTGENKFGRRNLKKICLKYLSSQGPWTSMSEQVMKSVVYNKKKEKVQSLKPQQDCFQRFGCETC